MDSEGLSQGTFWGGLKEGEFEVEDIIRVKETNGTFKILIKWKGYEKHESTWGTVDDIRGKYFRDVAEQMIKEYKERARRMRFIETRCAVCASAPLFQWTRSLPHLRQDQQQQRKGSAEVAVGSVESLALTATAAVLAGAREEDKAKLEAAAAAVAAELQRLEAAVSAVCHRRDAAELQSLIYSRKALSTLAEPRQSTSSESAAQPQYAAMGTFQFCEQHTERSPRSDTSSIPVKIHQRESSSNGSNGSSVGVSPPPSAARRASFEVTPQEKEQQPQQQQVDRFHCSPLDGPADFRECERDKALPESNQRLTECRRINKELRVFPQDSSSEEEDMMPLGELKASKSRRKGIHAAAAAPDSVLASGHDKGSSSSGTSDITCTSGAAFVRSSVRDPEIATDPKAGAQTPEQVFGSTNAAHVGVAVRPVSAADAGLQATKVEVSKTDFVKEFQRVTEMYEELVKDVTSKELNDAVEQQERQQLEQPLPSQNDTQQEIVEQHQCWGPQDDELQEHGRRHQRHRQEQQQVQQQQIQLKAQPQLKEEQRESQGLQDSHQKKQQSKQQTHSKERKQYEPQQPPNTERQRHQEIIPRLSEHKSVGDEQKGFSRTQLRHQQQQPQQLEQGQPHDYLRPHRKEGERSGGREYNRSRPLVAAAPSNPREQDRAANNREKNKQHDKELQHHQMEAHYKRHWESRAAECSFSRGRENYGERSALERHRVAAEAGAHDRLPSNHAIDSRQEPQRVQETRLRGDRQKPCGSQYEQQVQHRHGSRGSSRERRTICDSQQLEDPRWRSRTHERPLSSDRHSDHYREDRNHDRASSSNRREEQRPRHDRAQPHTHGAANAELGQQQWEPSQSARRVSSEHRRSEKEQQRKQQQTVLSARHSQQEKREEYQQPHQLQEHQRGTSQTGLRGRYSDGERQKLQQSPQEQTQPLQPQKHKDKLRQEEPSHSLEAESRAARRSEEQEQRDQQLKQLEPLQQMQQQQQQQQQRKGPSEQAQRRQQQHPLEAHPQRQKSSATAEALPRRDEGRCDLQHQNYQAKLMQSNPQESAEKPAQLLGVPGSTTGPCSRGIDPIAQQQQYRVKQQKGLEDRLRAADERTKHSGSCYEQQQHHWVRPSSSVILPSRTSGNDQQQYVQQPLLGNMQRPERAQLYQQRHDSPNSSQRPRERHGDPFHSQQLLHHRRLIQSLPSIRYVQLPSPQSQSRHSR